MCVCALRGGGVKRSIFFFLTDSMRLSKPTTVCAILFIIRMGHFKMFTTHREALNRVWDVEKKGRVGVLRE